MVIPTYNEADSSAGAEGARVGPRIEVLVFYAREALLRWTRGRGPRATIVSVSLGVLFLAVVATFTIGPVFSKSHSELAGLEWRGPSAP